MRRLDRIGLAASFGMMFFGFGVGPAADYGLGGTFLLLALLCTVVAGVSIYLLEKYS